VWRVLLGLFLVAHGLIHAAIWVTPKPTDPKAPPFDASRSWLLNALGVGESGARALRVVLALAATAGFAAAGLAVLFGAGWWRPLAVVSAAVSLVLMLVYFNSWLLLGVAIDVGIIAVLLVAGWPSKALVGS
jgi:hypothetical protein